METERATKESVSADFEFRGGIIISPGKFEAEVWFAPIVYDWYLNGDAGEMFGDTNVYILTPEDRKLFELREHDFAIALSVSDQGFVYVGVLDETEYWQLDQEEFEDYRRNPGEEPYDD